jgi:predicted enzyme related to lactoylglutathione lyase
MTDVREETATDSRAAARGAFIWYELMTPDAEGAKAFYDAVVGWDIGEPVAEFEGYRMIGRSDGGMAGGVLQITDEMREHGAHPIWLGYIAVDDVDATVAEIEKRGGKALMPAQDIGSVGRIAMVADPQGVPFYVMKPIPPEGREGEESDVFSPTEEQRVGWNELTTPDPVAARQFYGELFGWTSDDFMPMGEMGEYRFLAHASQTLGAVCGVQPGGSKGWRYYFRVPSIGRAVEAVTSGGGSVSMGPHEVPGGDQIVIGQDPQGAEFALVGKA